jgi:undecaprenyl-diphosphatase
MQTRQWIWIEGFVAAALAVALFGWLASAVLQNETIWFDATIRNGVHALASPPLTSLMRGITELGAPVWLVTVSIVLVWRLVQQGRRHAAVMLVVAAVGAEVLDEILKLVFRRARPEAFFGYAEPITYSFPSGHSVASACFYGVLAAILTVRMKSHARRIAIWTAAALLAFLIGLSRIYLGVHYPSDVLAGYATAVIWVVALRTGYDRWRLKRPVAQ